MAAQTVWLARQPIFDSKVRVKAYEVLFRACDAPSAPSQLPEFATASVGVQSLLDLGLDRLVGDSNLWINVPRDVLVSGQFA
jgi:c-di-GMP-related signal transduction protein